MFVSLRRRTTLDPQQPRKYFILSLIQYRPDKPTRSLPQPKPWQIEANTEAADAAAPEANHAVEAEVDEEVERVAEDVVVLLLVENGRRRRTFWIWGSIWIRGLLLSLMAGGKVRFLPLYVWGLECRR